MKTARYPRASEVRSAPLAVFVATQAEMKPLTAVLQPTRPSVCRSDSVVRVRVENRDLLLAKTGVGPDNAKAAARHLFDATLVTAALSIGIAGGLSPQVQTGDLIVGDRVIRRRISGQVTRGERDERLEVFPGDRGLQETVIAAIRRLGSRHWLGPILTVDRIARTTQEKRVLAAGSGAIALDMESAAIASVASAYAVPFLAIRGVLDPIYEDLPIDFDRFLDVQGEPSLPRLMRYLITHPLILPHMVRLGLRTRAACARLGLLLQRLSLVLN